MNLEVFNFFYYTIIFFAGASVGSFIGAIVSRMDPNKEPGNIKEIMFYSSHCDSCKHKLTAWELFPVFSYILLKGRCSNCKQKIDPGGFVLELVSGLTLLGLMLRFFYDSNYSYFQILFVVSIVFAFIYFAYYDYLFWEVPLNSIILVFLIVVVIYIGGYATHQMSVLEIVDKSKAAIYAMLGIIFIIIASKGKGMGWGDVWIMGLVGLFLGTRGLVEVFYVAIVSGAFAGIVKAVFYTNKLKGVLIQFVPFITLGLIVAVFSNQTIYYLMFGNLEYYLMYIKSLL